MLLQPQLYCWSGAATAVGATPLSLVERVKSCLKVISPLITTYGGLWDMI